MADTPITARKIRRALRPESPDCSREKTVVESTKSSSAAATRPMISHQSLWPNALPCSVLFSAAGIAVSLSQRRRLEAVLRKGIRRLVPDHNLELPKLTTKTLLRITSPLKP